MLGAGGDPGAEPAAAVGTGFLEGTDWGLRGPALLTPERSVLMALTCRQSSTAWLVLLASALSSEPLPPGSALASLSPFSLSSGARRCTSLRCFLVT